MNPRHIRAFEVEGTRFHLTDRGDGTLQVTSIHPYDETEYHWALQASKSCWHICRCGHRMKTLPEHTEMTPEQVAHYLIAADREAGLTPRRAIW